MTSGPPPFLVAGDGAVCWRVDPPLTASESVMLTEPEPARPDATAELARLLGELRQLRAEVEQSRALPCQKFSPPTRVRRIAYPGIHGMSSTATDSMSSRRIRVLVVSSPRYSGVYRLA
jgi:hypothetical protein